MLNLWRDVAVCGRRLRRNPLFFIGAVTLIAVAVGGNAAMFTIVNAVLLRPLPLRDADRVVALHVVREGTPRGAFPLPLFLDVASTVRSFDGVAAWFQWSANLTDAGDAERVQAMRATGNYLQVLGASAALGRTLTQADGEPGAASAVVISDGLWRRRFGGLPETIGRPVRLNGEVFTIVGVLPPEFTFQLRDADLIAAWAPAQDPRRGNAALSFLRIVGRLKPHASVAQATGDLEERIREYRIKYPEAGAGDQGGRVVGLREDLVGSVDRVLRMLAVAVLLVLLIAGANLTNLLLVNGAGRLHEFAARRALGASSRRIVTQLLTETVILALVGGVLGLVLAQAAVSGLLTASATPIPRASEISMDGTTLVFAVGLALTIGVAAALLPALQLAFAASQGIAAQRAVTLGGRRLRAGFVCVEVALSVVLVVWAGLLVRSFAAVQRIDPGFQPSGVLSLRLSLPRASYSATADLARFTDQLAARIRAVPGVSSVAAANVVPMNGYLASATIQPPSLEGRPPAEWPDVHYRMISPDYFATMGIPVVAGRRFIETDNAGGAAVAIVSHSVAKRYWRDGNPIGTQLRVRDSDAFRDVQIIGVAGDVRHFGLELDSPGEIYVPIPQVPDPTSVWLANNMYWVARTHGTPLAYAAALRREVASVDATVASSFVRSMDQWVAQSVDPRRFNLLVIAVFAATALLLAAIGIYSVAAEAVAVRTREMGVRSALGATDAQLIGAVVTGGLTPVLGGALGGVVAALVSMSALRSFFYGITSHDPATFAAVFLVVAALGALALYVPARRVTRIDPVTALRAE
jgi:putative ABC transport system permease protein